MTNQGTVIIHGPSAGNFLSAYSRRHSSASVCFIHVHVASRQRDYDQTVFLLARVHPRHRLTLDKWILFEDRTAASSFNVSAIDLSLGQLGAYAIYICLSFIRAKSHSLSSSRQIGSERGRRRRQRGAEDSVLIADKTNARAC